jgi:ketosteroid isomerase-like protein
MSAADPNSQLVETFYTHFQKRDYAGMNACYHPEATFSDPVFIGLRGKQVQAMWHMLCESGQDLKVEFGQIHGHGDHVHAHWEATYSFSAQKRQVHNIIDATFEFRDGKIISHHDHFDLWRWTRMALGMPGVLLGWSPIVQNKVRATAQGRLTAFIAKHPEYQG